MERAAPIIRRLDPRRPDRKAIVDASAALARGALVVVPTETVYGLAADPRVPGAVELIYGAKNRARRKPITLLAADAAQVRAACGGRLGARAQRLAAKYWPGPLTLVLKTREGFEGFRVPDHAVARALLREAGVPLAVTSANRSGEAPAVTARQAAVALGRRVAVILDAGKSPGGVPSTVVKVEGRRVEILREGAIPAAKIFRTAKA